MFFEQKVNGLSDALLHRLRGALQQKVKWLITI
jgi:hypothetical protein